MTNADRISKKMQNKAHKLYASTIAYISFKRAQVEPDCSKRDMLFYKSYTYGQIANRML